MTRHLRVIIACALAILVGACFLEIGLFIVGTALMGLGGFCLIMSPVL